MNFEIAHVFDRFGYYAHRFERERKFRDDPEQPPLIFYCVPNVRLVPSSSSNHVIFMNGNGGFGLHHEPQDPHYPALTPLPALGRDREEGSQPTTILFGYDPRTSLEFFVGQARGLERTEEWAASMAEQFLERREGNA